VIGIYQDSFLKYLQDNFGDTLKIVGKEIIMYCPFCGYKKNKTLYISLDAPVFHCFHAGCNKGGIISKLLKKIDGTDNSEKFVSKEVINETIKNKIKINNYKQYKKELTLPELDEDKFKLKSLYLKKRFGFNQLNFKNVKGLIFDVNSFLEMNNIPIDEKLIKMKDFLHSNFIGFVSEHNSKIVFRNINEESNFRYYKIITYKPIFSDYYKIFGGDYNSNIVILGEGIFDIILENIFDSIEMKDKAKLYAAGLSAFYDSLCKSIVFNENIFRLNVHILSDNGINLNYYKNIKKFNSHIIETMTVYYNRRGKDFADVPVSIEKFII